MGAEVRPSEHGWEMERVSDGEVAAETRHRVPVRSDAITNSHFATDERGVVLKSVPTIQKQY
jgi:hypothetical protein